MVGTLVLALVVIALVAWGGRRALSHGGPRVSDGASIRRFFTYLVLFGLLMVAVTGVVGLLARVIDVGRPTEGFEDLRAQQTAFAVVGLPLYVVLAAWTRGHIRSDPTEARSRGFSLYLTAASVVSVVSVVLAVQSTVGWALGVPFSGGSQFAEIVVWGGVWLVHRAIERRVVGRDVLTVAGLLGAAVGLGVASAGTVLLLGGLLGQVLGIPTSTAVDAPSAVQLGVMTLAAGLPAWVVCWLLPARHLQRGTLWHVLVLLVGVAGGLLTAVVGASVALDRLLVWLLRGAGGSGTSQLEALPWALGAVVVGGVVWAYHRAVLRPAGDTGRTEVRRAYDYLLAGVGIVAAAVGLVVMIVAGVEGWAAPTQPSSEGVTRSTPSSPRRPSWRWVGRSGGSSGGACSGPWQRTPWGSGGPPAVGSTCSCSSGWPGSRPSAPCWRRGQCPPGRLRRHGRAADPPGRALPARHHRDVRAAGRLPLDGAPG